MVLPAIRKNAAYFLKKIEKVLPPSSFQNGGKNFFLDFSMGVFVVFFHFGLAFVHVPVGLLQKDLHAAVLAVGIGNCVAVSILKMELLAVGIVVACFLADV